MGKNKVYPSAPIDAVPEVGPGELTVNPTTGKPLQHGVRAYFLGCRCAICSSPTASSCGRRGPAAQP